MLQGGMVAYCLRPQIRALESNPPTLNFPAVNIFLIPPLWSNLVHTQGIY